MGKKIYGFILFVYLCIAVSAGEFRKGRESNTIEEFYKLKYCSTVVYMVPRA